MKYLTYLLVSISMFLLLTACGNDENTGTVEGQDATETSDESEGGDAEDAQSEEESEENKSSASGLGDFHIDFSGEVIESGDKFIIEGQTNLIPGSRLVGELIVSEDTVYSDTTELVQDDGSFYMELDHHQYGTAEIVVRFDFTNVQDDTVLRHYGEHGQKLDGPFIYKHKHVFDYYKMARVSVFFDPHAPTDLTFKAPDWHPLPDDYGDPRIWIEVDEITTDKEFYYLHGRSNILEGAEIRGSFANQNSSTQILPDGSFNLKIPYVYKEDTDFVITFRPQFQWDEIEEAYGSTGQKLVGNLVVTNSFNNEQTIEKTIPWDGNE